MFLIKKNIFYKISSNENGVVALEFALVSPVIIFSIMAILQLGLAAWAKSTLEISIKNAARFAITGESDLVEIKTRDEVIMESVKDAMSLFPLAPSKEIIMTTKVYSNFEGIGKPEPDDNNNGVCDAGETYTDLNGNGVFDLDSARTGFGNANDVVIYQVTFPLDTMIPIVGDILRDSGFFNLQAKAAVQNEPFGTAAVSAMVRAC
jgi:hypothetical protein